MGNQYQFDRICERCHWLMGFLGSVSTLQKEEQAGKRKANIRIKDRGGAELLRLIFIEIVPWGIDIGGKV
jgi:hypothetical protein